MSKDNGPELITIIIVAHAQDFIPLIYISDKYDMILRRRINNGDENIYFEYFNKDNVQRCWQRFNRNRHDSFEERQAYIHMRNQSTAQDIIR